MRLLSLCAALAFGLVATASGQQPAATDIRARQDTSRRLTQPDASRRDAVQVLRERQAERSEQFRLKVDDADDTPGFGTTSRPAVEKIEQFRLNPSDVDVSSGSGASGKPPADQGSTTQRPHVLRPVALVDQVTMAEALRSSAAARPNDRYASPEVAVQHRRVLAGLVGDVQRLEQKEAALSPRDRAMTRYLVASANARAQSLEERWQTQLSARPGPDELASLQTTALSVRTARARVDEGQPPVDYRSVRVSVIDRATNAQVKGLRVYVLPSGVLDAPQNYSRDLIRDLLKSMTLENVTSPTQGTVPVADSRVWVGPEYAYDQMQEMVIARKVRFFKPVHARISPETLELVFHAPGDIVGSGTKP